MAQAPGRQLRLTSGAGADCIFLTAGGNTNQPVDFVSFARTEGRFARHFNADGEADHELPQHLVARQESVMGPPNDLQVVVCEADGTVSGNWKGNASSVSYQVEIDGQKNILLLSDIQLLKK